MCEPAQKLWGEKRDGVGHVASGCMKRFKEGAMRIIWTLAILAALGMTGLSAGSSFSVVDQAWAGCTPGRDC